MSATDKDIAIKHIDNETESKNHIVLELSKICRVCLLECSDLRSLFDEEPYRISDMIMTFVPIQIIQDDPLPPSICTQCAAHVSRAVTVKQQIETAEATLRNFIAVGYLDVKMQPDEELESLVDKTFDHSNDDNDDNDHFSSHFCSTILLCLIAKLDKALARNWLRF